MKHQNNMGMAEQNFPRKLLINKNEIYDKDTIANSFNDYRVNLGSN